MTSGAGPIRLELDRQGRVSLVQVLQLPEELRTSSALDAALQEAFARAHADELPPAPLELDAQGRPRVARVTAPQRRPLRDLVHQAMGSDRSVPTTRSTDVVRHERGVSDNDCLTVLLDPAGQGGSLEADPGWLRQAAPAQVGTAITQAFHAAYSERTPR